MFLYLYAAQIRYREVVKDMIVPKEKIIKFILTVGSTVIIAIATKIIEEYERNEHEEA